MGGDGIIKEEKAIKWLTIFKNKIKIVVVFTSKLYGIGFWPVS